MWTIAHLWMNYLKQSQALWESEGVERDQILPESQRVYQNEQQPKDLTPQWFNDGGLLPGVFFFQPYLDDKFIFWYIFGIG